MLVNHAWNIGVQLATMDYIAVLNDDIIVYDKTFMHMKRQCDLGKIWCPYFTRREDFNKIYSANTENIVGFCFGFRKDQSQFPIPENIKLWFGDNWLYHKHGRDIGYG